MMMMMKARYLMKEEEQCKNKDEIVRISRAVSEMSRVGDLPSQAFEE